MNALGAFWAEWSFIGSLNKLECIAFTGLFISVHDTNYFKYPEVID